MTYFYYKTTSRSSDDEPKPENISLWERLVQKKNWRIVQLTNGYFQTEFSRSEEQWVDVTRRSTIEGAEAAIDASIEHYNNKLSLSKGPVVVKTFE